MAFLADSNQLASASEDATVRVWDAKTGQPLHTLERVGCVYSMAFSGNASRLLTNNRTILLPLPASTSLAFLLKASARAISIVKR